MKKIIYIFILILFYKVSYTQEDTIQTDIVFKEYNYKNGKIASKGHLKNDQPIGYWTSYYITGIKKSEGKWLNSKLDSIWIFYDQLGDTVQKINYFAGKKNGYHFKYFRTEEYKNTIQSQELYVNGKRNDKSIYYFENGLIKEIIPYIDDRKQGIGFKYDNNGKIISIIRYRNNEIIVQENINRYNNKHNKEGSWREFYTDGKVKIERNYTNGKLNGYVKLYNEEGKLVETIKYKNGEVDLDSNDFESNIEIREEYDDENNIIFLGSFNREIPIGVHRYFNKMGRVIKSKTYNINGKLIAEGIVLISGLESGDWTYYYENGSKKANGKYINGKKTNDWIYFYLSGKTQQKGSFSSGKLSGMWQWYYETGELLKEEYYIYGHADGEATEYDVLGNIIAKGNYIEGNKEGEWIYIIGDQKYIGKFVMNEKDGIWNSYYLLENKLSFEGRYVQGNPDGKHEYYYPNGFIKEEKYYSEGRRVKSWSKYTDKGKLIIVVQYRDGKEYKINGEKVNLSDSYDN